MSLLVRRTFTFSKWKKIVLFSFWYFLKNTIKGTGELLHGSSLVNLKYKIHFSVFFCTLYLCAKTENGAAVRCKCIYLFIRFIRLPNSSGITLAGVQHKNQRKQRKQTMQYLNIKYKLKTKHIIKQYQGIPNWLIPMPEGIPIAIATALGLIYCLIVFYSLL